MFDLFEAGLPEGWEPIPDEVLAELPCLDDFDPPPAGMSPALGHPDDLIWQALDRHLGVETLPLIAAAPVAELSPAGRSLALRRLDELTAHLEAVKATLAAAIAGDTAAPLGPDGRCEEFAAHEIGVATRSSVYAADQRIRLARDHTGRLAASAAALAAGRMTYPQAVALSEATAQLPEQITREVEAAVLRLAHRHNLGQFKAALRRWLAKKDPNFTTKAKAARSEPVVEHRAGDDGCGELFIRGPLEITTQVSMALNAYAAKTKRELGGTADARKVAGLRDLVECYLGSPGAARHHARLPIVNVCIDLATLLGLRNGIAEKRWTRARVGWCPVLASHQTGHTPPPSHVQLA